MLNTVDKTAWVVTGEGKGAFEMVSYRSLAGTLMQEWPQLQNLLVYLMLIYVYRMQSTLSSRTPFVRQ